MVLSSSEGPPDWCDYVLRVRNIFSCLLYLLVSQEAHLPNGFQTYGIMDSFSFLCFIYLFFKINFADERWRAFRKSNFIGGPLNGQVALISSSLRTPPPSILSFPAQYSRATGSHCSQNSFAWKPGYRGLPELPVVTRPLFPDENNSTSLLYVTLLGQLISSMSLLSACKYWVLMNFILFNFLSYYESTISRKKVKYRWVKEKEITKSHPPLLALKISLVFLFYDYATIPYNLPWDLGLEGMTIPHGWKGGREACLETRLLEVLLHWCAKEVFSSII